MLQPESGKSQFHPSNLVNRDRIEGALYPGARGASLAEMGTVAEMLCHTAAVTLDLAHASRSRRVEELFKAGYLEVLTLDGKSNLKPFGPVYASLNADAFERHSQTVRFKLTQEGRELVEFAKSRPYVSVDALDRVRFEFDRDNDLKKADHTLEVVLKTFVSGALSLELFRGCHDAEEMIALVKRISPRELSDGDAMRVERAIRERFLVLELSSARIDKLEDLSKKFEEGNH